MREIKFRAWDGKNIIHNQFMISAYGHINKVEPARAYRNWKIEDWILMQYTGQKDRNGKEIWEGDIVKYFATEMFEDDKGEVFWSEGSACFGIDWDDMEPEFAGDCVWDIYEVMGNIWENPELRIIKNEE